MDRIYLHVKGMFKYKTDQLITPEGLHHLANAPVRTSVCEKKYLTRNELLTLNFILAIITPPDQHLLKVCVLSSFNLLISCVAFGQYGHRKESLSCRSIVITAIVIR